MPSTDDIATRVILDVWLALSLFLMLMSVFALGWLVLRYLPESLGVVALISVFMLGAVRIRARREKIP